MIRAALISALSVVCLYAGSLAAESLKRFVEFDIPAQTLESALFRFSEQSRLQVVVSPELVAKKQSKTLNGELPVLQALSTMLAGTDLKFAVVNERTVAIFAAGAWQQPWKGAEQAF